MTTSNAQGEIVPTSEEAEEAANVLIVWLLDHDPTPTAMNQINAIRQLTVDAQYAEEAADEKRREAK